MSANIHHRWQRYWLPMGATLNLDADGFLPDPECRFGRHYNPGARQRRGAPQSPAVGQATSSAR